MRTKGDYFEALSKLKPNIYIGGEVVGRDDPRLIPGKEVVLEAVQRKPLTTQATDPLGTDQAVLSLQCLAQLADQAAPLDVLHKVP